MFKQKPHYDLFAIVEWTAAIAFICSLLAGSGGKATWTSDFSSLPPDDSTLLSWLEERDRQDVDVSRENNSVTLEASTGVVAGILSSFNALPKPPWQELGYPPPQGMRGSTSWKLFTGSTYLWITGFGILLLLGQIRRRYIKPRQLQRRGGELHRD
jgi:hypothetical protein